MRPVAGDGPCPRCFMDHVAFQFEAVDDSTYRVRFMDEDGNVDLLGRADKAVIDRMRSHVAALKVRSEVLR